MQKRARKLTLAEPRLQPDETAASVSPIRVSKSPTLQIKVTGAGLKTSLSAASVRASTKDKASPGDADSLSPNMRKPKTRFDPVATVRTRYINCGWTVISPPRGSINDLIAQRDARFHFIQVAHVGAADSLRYEGTQRGAFIQNAFSNGAVPVHASVRSRSCDMPNGSHGFIAEIDLRDVNRDSRVVISAVSRADTQ